MCFYPIYTSKTAPVLFVLDPQVRIEAFETWLEGKNTETLKQHNSDGNGKMKRVKAGKDAISSFPNSFPPKKTLHPKSYAAGKGVYTIPSVSNEVLPVIVNDVEYCCCVLPCCALRVVMDAIMICSIGLVVVVVLWILWNIRLLLSDSVSPSPQDSSYKRSYDLQKACRKSGRCYTWSTRRWHSHSGWLLCTINGSMSLTRLLYYSGAKNYGRLRLCITFPPWWMPL